MGNGCFIAATATTTTATASAVPFRARDQFVRDMCQGFHPKDTEWKSHWFEYEGGDVVKGIRDAFGCCAHLVNSATKWWRGGSGRAIQFRIDLTTHVLLHSDAEKDGVTRLPCYRDGLNPNKLFAELIRDRFIRQMCDARFRYNGGRAMFVWDTASFQLLEGMTIEGVTTELKKWFPFYQYLSQPSVDVSLVKECTVTDMGYGTLIDAKSYAPGWPVADMIECTTCNEMGRFLNKKIARQHVRVKILCLVRPQQKVDAVTVTPAFADRK